MYYLLFFYRSLAYKEVRKISLHFLQRGYLLTQQTRRVSDITSNFITNLENFKKYPPYRIFYDNFTRSSMKVFLLFAVLIFLTFANAATVTLRGYSNVSCTGPTVISTTIQVDQCIWVSDTTTTMVTIAGDVATLHEFVGEGSCSATNDLKTVFVNGVCNGGAKMSW
jgi:hypothetical protein